MVLNIVFVSSLELVISLATSRGGGGGGESPPEFYLYNLNFGTSPRLHGYKRAGIYKTSEVYIFEFTKTSRKFFLNAKLLGSFTSHQQYVFAFLGFLGAKL